MKTWTDSAFNQGRDDLGEPVTGSDAAFVWIWMLAPIVSVVLVGVVLWVLK